MLSVPQFDDERPTLEDATVRTAADRERLYGQSDHVRNYGVDFADRLNAARLRPQAVDATSFRRELVERHVLEPPRPIAATYGWNKRRVYFARKDA